MKTILITGCSSGFGLATASLFAARGWNVVATMRTPSEEVLPASERLRVLPLDVTDPASIAALVEAAGQIDAARQQCRHRLAERRRGHSDRGRPRNVRDEHSWSDRDGAGGAAANAGANRRRDRQRHFDRHVRTLAAAVDLHATKAAVNAWSDSIAIELEPFGIRVRVVLPGMAPATSFYGNAEGRMAGAIPAPYIPLAQSIMETWRRDTEPVTSAEELAEGIWRAVTDEGAPAHIPAGADAVAWAATR